ncbi:MAG: TIGR00730 family Rossman fold protein [Planctomycetota bacterium]|nr:TIGR00730 family Rossman fold protein [Planctomycetota bacterium]
MRVAVYCASSDEAHHSFRDDAAALGTAIGAGGHQLIYGGGNIGSMGALAEAASAAGASVISVIPRFFHERGLTYDGSTEVHVTEDMQQRRKMMWERSEGVITLPGGFGTLEELSEMLVLNQLELVQKPVVLTNLNGYWNPLWNQFEQMAAHRMLPTGYQKLIRQATDGVAALVLLQELLTGGS